MSTSTEGREAALHRVAEFTEATRNFTEDDWELLRHNLPASTLADLRDLLTKQDVLAVAPSPAAPSPAVPAPAGEAEETISLSVAAERLAEHFWGEINVTGTRDGSKSLVIDNLRKIARDVLTGQVPR